jgi:hypothetical protein
LLRCCPPSDFIITCRYETLSEIASCAACASMAS